MEKGEKAAPVKSGGDAAEDMPSFFDRKRKLYHEIRYACGRDVELAADSAISLAASGCSKVEEESGGVVKESLPDLEDNYSRYEDCESGAEISTSTFFGCSFRRETSQTRESSGKSEEIFIIIPSPTKRPCQPQVEIHSKFPSDVAEVMPTAAELEEFFVAAENYEQKRFAQKYNYDIVNDVPLEGKYQWVHLHP